MENLEHDDLVNPKSRPRNYFQMAQTSPHDLLTLLMLAMSQFKHRICQVLSKEWRNRLPLSDSPKNWLSVMWPPGDRRERILQGDALPMSQCLSMAPDLVDTLEHVHSRGVIWGDISTRNILPFDDFHIKLCDFASFSLRGVCPDLLFSCEPRCWTPKTNLQARKEAFLRSNYLRSGPISVRLRNGQRHMAI